MGVWGDAFLIQELSRSSLGKNKQTKKKIRKENCAPVNFSASHKRFMAAVDGTDGAALVYICESQHFLHGKKKKINVKNKTLECSTLLRSCYDTERRDRKVHRGNVHMRYFERVIEFFQGIHAPTQKTTNELPEASLTCPKAFRLNHSQCNNIKKAAAGALEQTC